MIDYDYIYIYKITFSLFSCVHVSKEGRACFDTWHYETRVAPAFYQLYAWTELL